MLFLSLESIARVEMSVFPGGTGFFVLFCETLLHESYVASNSVIEDDDLLSPSVE